MSDRSGSPFARWVEHHVLHGERLDPAALCADRPDLLPELAALIARYLDSRASLAGLPSAVGRPAAAPAAPALPAVRGVPHDRAPRRGRDGRGLQAPRPEARSPRGGEGRPGRPARREPRCAEFLAEARALALFQDRRIVQIHEFRDQADPPVLIMEYVDGFELGRLAPSLEFRQRARIMKEVCEAVQHAHDVGVQHRDLKPSNIMLDARAAAEDPRFRPQLERPRARAFPRHAALPGARAARRLAAHRRAHRRLRAWAPSCTSCCRGVPPVGGATRRRRGRPTSGRRRSALPVEIAPGVPEPLQAIALKALERRPADRYPVGARHGARPRALPGRPAGDGAAQPLRVGAATRVRPHLDQIDDWLRLKLIYPHEAAAAGGVPRPRAARRRLDRREPGAVVLADRAVPRRVPPDVRQPVLLRRAPVPSRREGRAAAVRSCWACRSSA